MTSGQSLILVTVDFGYETDTQDERKEKTEEIKTTFLFVLVNASPGEKRPRSGLCLIR